MLLCDNRKARAEIAESIEDIKILKLGNKTAEAECKKLEKTSHRL